MISHLRNHVCIFRYAFYASERHNDSGPRSRDTRCKLLSLVWKVNLENCLYEKQRMPIVKFQYLAETSLLSREFYKLKMNKRYLITQSRSCFTRACFLQKNIYCNKIFNNQYTLKSEYNPYRITIWENMTRKILELYRSKDFSRERYSLEKNL